MLQLSLKRVDWAICLIMAETNCHLSQFNVMIIYFYEFTGILRIVAVFDC